MPSLFYICLELYFISQQMCHNTLYTLGWNLKNILCYFLISACDFYVDLSFCLEQWSVAFVRIVKAMLIKPQWQT